MKLLSVVACVVFLAVATPGAALSQTPAPSAAVSQVTSTCSACHSDSGPGVGPSLKGVAGRKAGTAAGFQYSPAMRNSQIVWSKDTLAAFIQAPNKKVPGARMAFAGVKDPALAKAVAEYLVTR